MINLNPLRVARAAAVVVQRLVRCHGLFANIQQTLKNGGCSLSAALIGNVWNPVKTNRKLTAKWSACIHQIVLCLLLGAFFASVSEARAKIRTDGTLDKRALLLDLNLHTFIPILESPVINSRNLRLEPADNASKIRPALFISRLLIVGSFALVSADFHKMNDERSQGEEDHPKRVWIDMREIPWYGWIICGFCCLGISQGVVLFFDALWRMIVTPNEKS